MSYFLAILVFILPVSGFSQYAIGKSMPEIKNELEKLAEKNKDPKPKINTTGSWVSYTTTTGGRTAELSFDFDKNGKCVIETIKAADKDAYDHYLNIALGIKDFEWKRINENQYLSKFSAYLMIELAGESVPNQFSFFKTEWNKEMYELLSSSRRD